VAAGISICQERGLAELQLWGDPTRPAPAGFISALGFAYRSSLWMYQLRNEVVVPEPSFPDGVVVRTFRPGADEAVYVALLNATFADYPSPLLWSEATIRLVHGLPGFDPGRILLVAPADDPTRLVGLVVAGRIGPDRAAGEVKFIALRPDWRGRGLGRELLRWAIQSLRAEGAAPIELRVEGRNERALRLYAATGFEPTIEWPQWVLPVPPADDR
jgi:mycothiol synthase